MDVFREQRPRSGFCLYSAWPTQIVLTLIALAGFGVYSAWAAATGRQGPGWVFTAIWFAVLGWNGYWFLLRVAWSLVLTDQSLEWRAIARSGSIPLRDLRRVRPMRGMGNCVVFEGSDRRPVIAITAVGFATFLSDLAGRVPGLPISGPRLGRLQERWPARSRYWRDP